MIKNYLVVAIRNLMKNGIFSAINIAGLGIGLACVIIIFGYVRLELSYDTFHSDHNNIYRITTSNATTGEQTAYNFMPLAPLLKENMSGLKRAVRIYPRSGLLSIDKKNKQRETNFCFADSTFFEMFNFQAIDGSLVDALDKPMSVVVTKSGALRFFGTSKVAGKELFFEDDNGVTSYNIAAVIEDMPENSHFNISFIASFASLQPWLVTLNQEKTWYWPPMYLYVQMTEGNTVERINGQLEKIAASHLPEYVKGRSFRAQKITDIHLYSNLQNEWQTNSNISYIRIFSTIALFILLLACINYMNLTMAKSAQRAGEVGIRKAMGSHRGQLIRMFFGESLVTSALAILLGLAIAQIGMYAIFNPLLRKTLSISFFLQWPYVLYLLSGWLLVSVLAGVYPAFYISSFSTIKALRGKAERLRSALGLRKGLVVFQFFVSALLLIGTFVVIRQIKFLQNKELGFNQEHIVTIPLNDDTDRKNYLILKNELLAQSIVNEVSVSAALPYGKGFFDWEISPEGFTDRKDLVIRSISSDEDFLKAYGIKLSEGRNFSKDILTDKDQAFIINKALARKLDWEDPVGKEFQLTFYTNGPVVRKGKIIGVVDDFHYQSLYNQIEPLVIFVNTHPYYTNFLSVQLAPGDISQQVNTLKAAWARFDPDKPFEFSFLDETLNRLYENEQSTGKLLTIFTGLSILISCLGLFGLASLTVQQRTKEIGVRKVLGASEFGIVRLLSNEFVVLVIVANFLAWPLGWYWANQWLSKFAYHVNVEAIAFITSILVILIITFLTVGYQSLKAALDNPIKSLRNE